MSDVSLPFALGDVPERAKRDGCGCPPWVMRCAHWGTAVAVLIDASLASPCLGVNNRPERGWTAGILPRGWDAVCECEESHSAYWAPVRRRYLKPFNSSAAALAAFHEAEQRLLDGAS